MMKTNAIRILENAKMQYFLYEYDVSDGDLSGISVAEKIGKAPEKVFKTLVTAGKTTGNSVFVIPCEYELDLKKAALAVGDKYIEMIRSRDLEHLTGYVHGGCSPVGMKKLFPTYIDEIASVNDTIFVNAGRVGLIVELSPDDLILIKKAEYCALV